MEKENIIYNCNSSNMIEYHLLKEIDSNPQHTQRTLAEKLGVSLGKVNYLVAGLVEQGVIKAMRLKSEPKSVRWQYLLTPRGVREKVAITKAYLNRRKEEYVAIKGEIAALEHEVGSEKV